MTEYVYVKPNGGRVRMPDRGGNVMPDEGTTVPRIDYYERAIIAGDVVICDPPKEEVVQDPPDPPNASDETRKRR